MSTRIIAGMELKCPDDQDRKNAVCRAYKVPQNPQDYFTSFLANSECQEAATAELGARQTCQCVRLEIGQNSECDELKFAIS